MPSPFLAAGAGAAGGLETLLARLRDEETLRQRGGALAETKRSNLADEDYKNRALMESTALRKDTNTSNAATKQAAQTSIDQNRKDQELGRQRDDARATLAQTPMGAQVTPDEKKNFIDLKAATQNNFAWEPPKLGSSFQGDATTPAGEVGPTPERITFKGTAAEQNAAGSLADREQRTQGMNTNRSAQTGIAQHRENRLTDWGPPTITIGDPSEPGAAKVISRPDLPQGGAAAAAPGTVRTNAISNEVGLDQLDRLEQMFNGGAKELIGPAAGRVGSLTQKIPGLPTDPKFNDFSAATAAFRNSVIKAITGAQMSEVEATRIREQIPDITDKPEVWQSKAQMTRKNLTDLQHRLGSTRGGAAAPSTTGPVDLIFDPATGEFRKP